jgi:trans-aconitate 2-methyltransferase
MSTPLSRWDARQYLKFEEERTLPSRDLVRRIELAGPTTILDLGCGPGNSTAILAERWPSARIHGVDSSAEMLETARASGTRAEWLRADLATWDPPTPSDLVFSNATLHWLPDHTTLVPRLFRWVAPAGALAFQVPARPAVPAAWTRALAEVRTRTPWSTLGGTEDPADANVLPLERYYDLLAPAARRVDLWDTEYDHVLPGPEGVVEWTRGTALRPWLGTLRSDAERAQFLDAYAAEVAREYPRRPDGRVVFPFLRRFVVAYR